MNNGSVVSLSLSLFVVVVGVVVGVLFCDRQQFVLFFFFVEKRNEREKNRVKKNVDTLNKNWSKKKRVARKKLL